MEGRLALGAQRSGGISAPTVAGGVVRRGLAGEARGEIDTNAISHLGATFQPALSFSPLVRFEIGSPEQSSGRRGPTRPPGRG